jgi:hypothetical protein
VALADLLADRQEVAEAHRVALDLGHPLGQVGHDVQPHQPLERVAVEDVGSAVPVVAHHDDVARRGARRGLCGGRQHRRERQRGHHGCEPRPCSHASHGGTNAGRAHFLRIGG